MNSCIEILESRIAPAVILVTTSADGTGKGTLRYAITQADLAKTPDSIKFSTTLSGDTITLATPLPTLTQSMTITGLGANKLAISGSAAPGSANFEIFNIQGGAKGINVTVSGLTLEHGTDFVAGGAMQINDHGGKVAITNAVIKSNYAGGFTSAKGGAIALDNGLLTLSGSTISGNTAKGSNGGSAYGGGLYIAATASAVISKSTISGNFAIGSAGSDGMGGGNGADGTSSSRKGGDGVDGTAGTDGGTGAGGGIYCKGVVTLTSTTISGNTTQGGNGGNGGSGGNGGAGADADSGHPNGAAAGDHA